MPSPKPKVLVCKLLAQIQRHDMISSDLSVIDTPIIKKALVALGSNYQSEFAFQITLDNFIVLGEVVMSDVIVGADYTQKTQSIYHNACVLLTLNIPCSFMQLSKYCKKIEMMCGRTHSLNQHNNIAMDLDILAVYTKELWQISQRRLPLKPYELIGLKQVAPFLDIETIGGY